MITKHRLLRWAWLLGLAWLVIAHSKAANKTPEQLILAVYSAENCPWCARWKRAADGWASIKAHENYGQMRVVFIERKRLREAFTIKHYPVDLPWLYQYDQINTVDGFVPQWRLWLGRQLLSSAKGYTAWGLDLEPLITDQLNAMNRR